ncbi:serine threonine protein kinase : Serine/threonine protein kinase OS=Isosphaera pallida (strain ATCC 43644 / DSM 9630 / IS1B) GN=Isop_1601 PE=4 SV=1: Pkinase: RDD [Gemmataceae bacterium]|nr:serine threonine protein kinase : Serine/threonine protein kinase OS=Isosphaera pallida (strain ATCC 43644 / DSM 9630 / IS1B) GN=Isop_1601 PE=4 SV=1: Pkinase: RDD [Gemmataceae bacterium]VTU01123.1 serine threonine protein kinase : Serine/threonine protein kinase OS=Isosphaera pallida (strain ATCC 43644 / DSM 9630 / IS1B) GN=Isop_1601 PE=4 SV=1: Pkinase: RDD [Gemmataceae bacterium]
MTITCPQCRRGLSSSDGGDAPAFCMYCGTRLSTSGGDHDATRTAHFEPLSGVSSAGEDVPFGPETAPKSIGGYKLLRMLGAGGMGAVYEAEEPGSSGRVAVKLLSSRLASSPTSVERFKQEGRLASQLSHPRCVFVKAADTDAGRPYIVMELMPGDTLKDAVDKRGPLPGEQAIRYMLDVIDGLAEAHRVGMIHRDMKPSNCFLTADGRVKVGDFGLSKSLIGSRDQHLTSSGAFLGTVLFASPEQIRGEPLDYGSDVYSVCATLYYLLCGEAPYQHESITAALAKAISEDAPPVRKKRPDVSRGLDALVMKGLDRDRDRRWQSLDDLREALVALLPSHQHPARPRVLIGAYLLDMIAVSIVTFPIEFVRTLGTFAEGHLNPVEVRPVAITIAWLYFGLSEGLFGATLGKMLLGLRVSRVGRTEPPGLLRGLLRAGVFRAMALGALSAAVLHDDFVRWFGATGGGVATGAIVVLAALGLLVQAQRRWGFRGVHDFASGCHVTQRPLPRRKLRLPVKHPTPLTAVLPPPAEPLPAFVGVYAVRGRLSVDPGGEQVWAGEDRALARSVLLWLRPAGDAPPPHEAARPTRLRHLGGGSLTWAGAAYDWVAFAAPLGAPLADLITPARPLRWADARLLLEQLVEEFRAAEADGTTPARIGLDRVWAETNGRLQVLECAAAAGPAHGGATPFGLLREVASLALEGRPRAHAGPVRAPVPGHAAPVLDRLFTDGGYESLADLQRDLAETHAHRPEVTPAVRAAQLGIQAAVLVLPFTLLFVLTAAVSPFLTLVAKVRAEQADAALAALHDPEKRKKLGGFRELAEPLKHPHLEERLAEYRDRKRREAAARRPLLFTPQRIVLEQVERQDPEAADREHGYPVEVREAVLWAGAADGTPRAKRPGPWRNEAEPILAVLVLVPLGFVAVATLLRGGVSMLVSGIAVVRADGTPARRRVCGLRAVVWFPVAAVLFASAALQVPVPEPERVYAAASLWLLAFVLLLVYVVVALRFPDRPPHDRITRTYLVPA